VIAAPLNALGAGFFVYERATREIYTRLPLEAVPIVSPPMTAPSVL